MTWQQDNMTQVYLYHKARQGNKPPIIIDISNILHNTSEYPNYAGLIWLVKPLWNWELASGVLESWNIFLLCCIMSRKMGVILWPTAAIWLMIDEYAIKPMAYHKPTATPVR